jgi:hypothetical protein
MHEEECRHLYWTSPPPRAIVKATWDKQEEEYRHLYLLDIAFFPCYCQSRLGSRLGRPGQ